MTHATKEQYAELVGYTGHDECMEIRLCTGATQVWSYDWDYGVGQGEGPGRSAPALDPGASF